MHLRCSCFSEIIDTPVCVMIIQGTTPSDHNTFHISGITPSLCGGYETWKNMKSVHYTNTVSKGFLVSTEQDLIYYADWLSDELDFRNHLNKILIPR